MPPKANNNTRPPPPTNVIGPSPVNTTSVSRPFRLRSLTGFFTGERNAPIFYPSSDAQGGSNKMLGSDQVYHNSAIQDKIRRECIRDASCVVPFDHFNKKKKSNIHDQPKDLGGNLKVVIEGLKKQNRNKKNNNRSDQTSSTSKISDHRAKMNKKAKSFLIAAKALALKAKEAHRLGRTHQKKKNNNNNNNNNNNTNDETATAQQQTIRDIISSNNSGDLDLSQVLVEFHVGGGGCGNKNENRIVTSWKTVQSLLDVCCDLQHPNQYPKLLMQTLERQRSLLKEDDGATSLVLVNNKDEVDHYCPIVPIVAPLSSSASTSSAAVTTTRYCFFVDRDPESFRLLIFALRRNQYPCSSTFRVVGETPPNNHNNNNNQLQPGQVKRLVPLFPTEEFRLLEEAAYFKIVPSVWRSLGHLQYQIPDHKTSTALIETALCKTTQTVGSETTCMIISPFVSQHCYDHNNNQSASSSSPPLLLDAIEVPVAIGEECENIGIGVISRSAAQNLDRSFHNERNCSVLFQSGVFHSNYFDRYRRFDTDAAFGPGDVISVRVDVQSRILTWRRSGILMLVERFSTPSDFVEPDEYRDYLLGKYLNEIAANKKYPIDDDLSDYEESDSDSENDDDDNQNNNNNNDDNRPRGEPQHHALVRTWYDPEYRRRHMKYCRKFAAKIDKDPDNLRPQPPGKKSGHFDDDLAIGIVLSGKSKIRVANYPGSTCHEGPKMVDLNVHENYENYFRDMASRLDFAPPREELAHDSYNHNGICRVGRFGNNRYSFEDTVDRCRALGLGDRNSNKPEERRRNDNSMADESSSSSVFEDEAASIAAANIQAVRINNAIASNIRTHNAPIQTSVASDVSYPTAEMTGDDHDNFIDPTAFNAPGHCKNRNTGNIMSKFQKPLNMFSFAYQRNPHHNAHRPHSKSTSGDVGKSHVNLFTPDTVVGMNNNLVESDTGGMMRLMKVSSKQEQHQGVLRQEEKEEDDKEKDNNNRNNNKAAKANAINGRKDLRRALPELFRNNTQQ